MTTPTPELPSYPTERTRQSVAEYITALHLNSELIVDDGAVDKLLFGKSITTLEREQLPDLDAVSAVYPGHNVWPGELPRIWTPYQDARILFTELNLDEGDTFCDLGAGYGRVALYGALTNPSAKFMSVELVTERSACAKNAVDELGLNNIDIICKDALDSELDLSEVTAFYMYDPFDDNTLLKVKHRLRNIAKAKPEPFSVVARNCMHFQKQDWLELTKIMRPKDGVLGALYFYASKQAGTFE